MDHISATARVKPLAPGERPRAGSCGWFAPPTLHECDLASVVAYFGEGNWSLPEGYKVTPGPISCAVKIGEGSGLHGLRQTIWTLLPDVLLLTFRDEERECLELPSAFVFDYARLPLANRQFRFIKPATLPAHYHFFTPGRDMEAFCSRDFRDEDDAATDDDQGA